MALRGSLSDMGIVDIVQFPHAGRKTGELIIVTQDEDARLFYREGKLYHAAMGEITGIDVLPELLDWSDGEFEFRPDSSTEVDDTIKTDMHRAIIQALKIRDEKKHREQKMAQASPKKEDSVSNRLENMLQQSTYGTTTIAYAEVLDATGAVIAKVEQVAQTEADLKGFRDMARQLVAASPRGALQRVLYEDEEGIVVISSINGEWILLVLADKSTNLGAVSMAVNRIVDALSESGR